MHAQLVEVAVRAKQIHIVSLPQDSGDIWRQNMLHTLPNVTDEAMQLFHTALCDTGERVCLQGDVQTWKV